MQESGARDPFHGLFRQHAAGSGGVRLGPQPTPPATLPDPKTGQALRIATVQLSQAICPACERKGDGAFVSFVSDLRLVFACPHCEGLVWIPA